MEFLGEFHPPIVHFAIALVIISVIFDFFGVLLKKDSLKNAGFWTLIVGGVAVVMAFITGHEAHELIEKAFEGTEAGERLELHEKVGTAVLIAVLLLTLFRVFISKKPDIRLMGIYLLMGFIVIAIVGLQGRIGGKLVYEYGIGVKPVLKEKLEKANNDNSSKENTNNNDNTEY